MDLSPSYCIFICHDCKIATYETDSSTSTYWHRRAHSHKEFQMMHLSHEVEALSDEHGKFSPEDFDFETREFKIG